MKRKVLLLFSRTSVNAGMAHPEELVALLNGASDAIETHAAILEDLVFFVDESNADVIEVQGGRSLRDYDVVYFRYWGQAPANAMAAARFCKLNNIHFIDNEVLRKGSQNKVTQYMILHEAKVPIPRTLIGQPGLLESYYERFGFVFPLVLKSVIGTRGRDNFLVHNKEEMQQTFVDNPDVVFAMQSFIPNDRDYRVLIMGDKVVGVIERKSSGESHLNNTSQGGSAAWLPIDDLSSDVHDLCIRATRFFSRDVAGVDVVRSLDDGRYYCFEVNRSPQIDHSSFEKEKAKLLAEYLTSLC